MRSIAAGIKLVLFVTSTLGLYGSWWITHRFVPNKVYWRQVFFAAWTKSFVRISQMKLEIIGTPPKPPFFLVTNHLSYTDIAALRAVVPAVFVAKAEVAAWPVAGRICRDMGTIFIDRGNRRDIPRAGDKILARLSDGEGVIVFPEGTSTRGDRVLKFNSSFLEFAAQANLPVHYAAVSYRVPAGELAASTAVCWWEDISFFAHIYRLLKLSEYTCVINFGDEPVASTDRKALASDLHRLVSDRFIPIL